MPKYMLMFVGDDQEWESQPKAELEKSYGRIMSWWDDLVKSGVVKGGEELKPQRTATTVRRVNGSMKVTDGPFVESKESVGGFSIIDVPDRDAAIALAKTWPGHAVEIREIVEQRPR